MNEDVKKIVDEVVSKVKADPSILANLKADPAGTIKGLVGQEVSEELMKTVENEVKAKVEAEGVEAILGKIGGLFSK